MYESLYVERGKVSVMLTYVRP